MPDSPSPEPAFVRIYTALRPTQWARSPLVSGRRYWSYLQTGDVVRLSEPLPVSGSHWQAARLADGRLCFIRPDDFSPTPLFDTDNKPVCREQKPV